VKSGRLSDFIGNTPLVKIHSLSELTGHDIFGKAEFLNPGGSIKDRTSLGIISEAEKSGQLTRGMGLIEGTAGNTGIGLAMLAAERGYDCTILMPDNQSKEKYTILKALGANLIAVPPCPFSSEKHFYHQARIIAQGDSRLFWANQFENKANFNIHFDTTGREIWNQTEGKIHAFISAAGTGGTIAGVSSFLKEKNSSIKIILADPMGSGLFSYIKNGVISSTGSSITEGIGIMRLTDNFKEAKIDDAFQVTDLQMISMLHHLGKHDGLLVGTSAALNVFATYRYALQLKGKKQTLVTILCDSAMRYQDKVFNEDFLKTKDILPVPLEKLEH
jgi:cysteine synthase A